jgi:hypothetical protein
MVFLSPLALLGLAAMAVPPLLHLFQRRRPADLEFPAVRYLEESARQARTAVRLRHLLLMLLRMLAVGLVAVAAARPVVPAPFDGVHEPTALVLVVDNSLSSGAVADGRRVLDDLALRARETLREARDADVLWLMTADGIARRGSSAELLEAVASLEPSSRRLDVGVAVRAAARLASTAGTARAEVHLLSDLQGSGVGAASAESLPAGIAVVAYHPPAAPPSNLGVAAARPAPGVWLARSPGASVVVGIAGSGGDSASGAPVTMTIGGRPVTRGLAGAGRTATLAAPRSAPGWVTGEVALEGDELRADDSRAFAVRVAPAPAVRQPAPALLGRFATEALAVLAEAGQVRLTPDAVITVGPSVHACAPRVEDCASIVVPPSDPVALGALNRALASRGAAWRFGARVEREDTIASSALAEVAGLRVRGRHALEHDGVGDSGAVLATVGGAPWLVRQGSVVLVASRLDPEDTDLPLAGAFVPFLGALTGRVARGEGRVAEAAPGDPVTLPPGVTSLARGDTVLRVDGGVTVAAPAEPGAWAMLAGADTAGVLVVAHDPRESDLTRADPRSLHAALPGAALAVTGDPGAYAARRFRGAGRSELTGWLLVAALALLLTESTLAAGGVRTER